MAKSFDQGQKTALSSIRKWARRKSDPQVFRLFGYAGTGKTTIAKEIYDSFPGTLCAAFTGKAVTVLQSKGMFKSMTIHSLLYVPVLDEATGKVRFEARGPKSRGEDDPLEECPLIIVDEVSMVNEELAWGLLGLGKKLLVMGDPFQLPPVEGDAYFMDKGSPDVMLTEVHRQAKDNPVIQLSMDIRNGVYRKGASTDVLPTEGGIAFVDKSKFDKDHGFRTQALNWQSQMIVGMNRTRRILNTQTRQHQGIEDEEILPKPGEKLVCLRNDRVQGLLNGSLWNVVAAGKPRMRKVRPTDGNMNRFLDGSGYLLYPRDYEPKIKAGKNVVVNAFPMKLKSLDFDSPPIKTYSPTDLFLSTEHQLDWRQLLGLGMFDFGYALTCHKSQGSQFDNVLLFDESRVFREQGARWLYTAVTRTVQNLTIIG